MPIACELVRISSGLTRQCPPSSKRQPVLAVAQVPGERGRLARADDQDVGQRRRRPGRRPSGRRGRGSPGRAAASPPRTASLRCVPRPAGRSRPACSTGPGGRAGRAGRRGRGRWPAPIASRRALIGQDSKVEPGRFGGGPLGRVPPGQHRPVRARRRPGRRGRRRRSRSPGARRPRASADGPWIGASWNWPSRSLRMATGGAPSRGQDQVEVAVVVDVEQAMPDVGLIAPEQRRRLSVQGVRAIVKPALDREAVVGRRERRPSLGVGAGRPGRAGRRCDRRHSPAPAAARPSPMNAFSACSAAQ